LDIKDKALKINFDPEIFGTFAEIGAGQEVAHYFFSVGGASRTIAKTMSAYDMTFSDAIYGKEPNKRYVSESRLNKMLDKEFSLLEKRLTGVRSENSRFFSFCNTVTTQHASSERDAHGWVGIKFQLKPKQKPSVILLHIRMLDQDIPLQQEAIGIIGLNLIYACYFHNEELFKLVESLMDGLSANRIEVDMIKANGPEFEEIDDRLLSLHLVESGMTNAVVFNRSGEVVQVSDLLYKKNILALRSRFRPPTLVNLDMFQISSVQFLKEISNQSEQLILLAEITLRSLKDEGEGQIDYTDFLSRVDLLVNLGKEVMITNFVGYDQLISYISKYTKLRKALIVGARQLLELMESLCGHAQCDGELLTTLGHFFEGGTELYIYPYIDSNKELVTTNKLKFPSQLAPLINYCIENNLIKDLSSVNQENLQIHSDEILGMIKEGRPGWESGVPKIVSETIKEKGLFGYNTDLG